MQNSSSKPPMCILFEDAFLTRDSTVLSEGEMQSRSGIEKDVAEVVGEVGLRVKLHFWLVLRVRLG